MKISKVLVVFGLFSIGTVLLAIFKNPDNLWLIRNQSEAEKYALALLHQNREYQPSERFIDYTISVSNGYVIFDPHESSQVLYGYAPEGSEEALKNANQDAHWKMLSSSWYVYRW